MMTLITTDFIAIISLLFLVNLTTKNVVIHPTQNRIFINAVFTTIILLILEIMTLFMEHSTSTLIVRPFRVANLLGFSLSPAVPFLLYLFFSHDQKRKSSLLILTLPLFINAFVCILSYQKGIIFFVDALNQYSRGPLFLLPTFTSMFYYLIFMVAVLRNSTAYERADKQVIFLIFLLPLFGISIQIIFKDIILLWSSVSISLLLYYTFLLELQFRYDVQTKIKNRAAFEKKMQRDSNEVTSAVLIMFDLNDLKVTNDHFGHKAGDELIIQTAKLIRESFIGLGTAYRIGGDEFCVISEECSEEDVADRLSLFNDRLNELNQIRQIKITVAYGYASYDRQGNKDLYAVLSQADQAMYAHKQQLKNTL